MVQYRRSSRSSWTKSIRSSFGRTVMGKAIWENPIGTRLGKGFQLGMLIRTPWKRIILICVCGWLEHVREKVPNWECLSVEREKGTILVCVCGRYQNGKQHRKHWPNVESTHERRWFWRTNIISWPCFLGCTQRDCQISKDIVDNYSSMFESRISAVATEKLPTRPSGKPDAETISSWSYDMEGRSKKCVDR